MYQIVNKTTNHRFSIKADESILAAALSAGFNFPYGCQKGLCGKCKGVVIKGEINHPSPLPKGIKVLERAEGFALMCQSKALSNLIIEVNEITTSTMIESKTYSCTVVAIEHLNHDVVKMTVKISNDTMQFFAGQYVNLMHPDFKARSFSIANAPTNSNLIEFHIRLVIDGRFTHFIFEELKEKTLLQIEGPKGSFYLRGGNMPIIMLAGGTGFGPIKAMIEHSLTSQKRPIVLYWGVRDEVDFYMNLPFGWANKYNHIKFIPVLSEANPNWLGRVGFVHEALLEDIKDLSPYEAYVCGPPIMVETAASTFITHGLKKQNFYSDAFELLNH